MTFSLLTDFLFHLLVLFTSNTLLNSSSDDNMLKNIELFDKLSLRFNGRILFIKDIIGDEICVWSYYGHQRKVAEICCTSIVYATEKKQTKVRQVYGCWSQISSEMEILSNESVIFFVLFYLSYF